MLPDRRDRLCIPKIRTAIEVPQLFLEPVQQIRAWEPIHVTKQMVPFFSERGSDLDHAIAIRRSLDESPHRATTPTDIAA